MAYGRYAERCAVLVFFLGRERGIFVVIELFINPIETSLCYSDTPLYAQ